MEDKVKKIGILFYHIIILILFFQNEYLKKIFQNNIEYIYFVCLVYVLISLYNNLYKYNNRYLLFYYLSYLYFNLLCIKSLGNLNILFFTINIIYIWRNILLIIQNELNIKNIYLNTYLSIFGVYYILKEKNIIRNYMNENFQIKLILILFLIWLIKENFEEISGKIKVFILKDFFRIIEFCQKILPFYLLKDGSLKIFPILLFGSIIEVIKNKEIKNKKIIFALSLNIIVIIISYLKCAIYGVDSKRNLIESIEVGIYLITLLNLNWNKKIIQESIYVFIVSSLLTIFSVIVLFSENAFKFTRYSDGFLIIPFGIKYSIISLLLLYIILKYLKYRLFPLFIINIFGVLLSGSRGPFGVFFILVLIMVGLLYKKNRQNLLKISIIVIIVGIAITLTNNNFKKRGILAIEGKDSSTIVRIKIYKEALRQFKNHPLLGNGIGSYGNVSKIENKNKKIENKNEYYALFYHTYSHNNVLGILSGIGILGLGTYIFLQYLLIKKLFKTNDFILGIIVYLCFELNGITDMTLIFYSIQKIMIFILVIVMSNKKVIKGNI